jgi:tetratricopeptide (TPR) repeat protein
LYRWQQGHTISQLSRSLGQSRQTVRKYLRQAERLVTDDHAQMEYYRSSGYFKDTPKADADLGEIACGKRPGRANATERAIVINLGLALESQGRTDEGIEALREAIRLRPDYAKGHYYLGLLLEVRGDLDEAIAEIELALQLDPGLTEATASLQKLRAGRGR